MFSPDDRIVEESPQVSRIPVGPLIATTALLALGGVYLLRSGSRTPEAQPPTSTVTDDVLRVASWDLGYADDPSGALSFEEVNRIAAELSAVTPHLVALRGLRDRAQADRIAGLLDDGWRVAVIPEHVDATRCLAILSSPGLQILARTLIDTPAGADALALTVEAGPRRLVRFVCVAGESLPPDARERYVERLLDWHDQQRKATTILAGYLGVRGETEHADASSQRRGAAVRRLAERFAAVTPSGQKPPPGQTQPLVMYVSPREVSLPTAAVIRSAGIDDIRRLPMVLDLVP